jgi:4-hydroxythreonine-4-phosphate dehydrogenase
VTRWSTIVDREPLAPLAVALGDPSGIGPEIVAKAWQQRRAHALHCFFAVGDIRSIEAVWDGPVTRISMPDEAAHVFDSALPIIQVDDPGEIIPGAPNLAGARSALDSLELAVGLTRSGTAGALVTAPVAKAALYAIGFPHPGQTEFVAERCGIARENVAMLMAGPSLKTVPVTIHERLRDVPDLLTTDLIVSRARTTWRGLRRNFGIENPRIAIAGLNPHAGEGGAFGDEEIEVILPAIEQLRGEDIYATGPHSADTMFDEHNRSAYDVALCMYHDQALIPLKTLHFDSGVNMTLGLPIVRASPDHGTAFALAGQNRARPDAMIAAIALAASCAGHRRDNPDL